MGSLSRRERCPHHLAIKGKREDQTNLEIMHASALRDHYHQPNWIRDRLEAEGLWSFDIHGYCITTISFFSFRDTREENDQKNNNGKMNPQAACFAVSSFLLLCSSGAGWLLGWLTGFYIKTMIQPASRGKNGNFGVGWKTNLCILTLVHSFALG